MQRLTVRQREFVGGMLQGCTQKEAARRAGYSAISEGSLEVEGTRQAHNPLVQHAVLEEGFKVIRSSGPKSIAVLASIAANTGAQTAIGLPRRWPCSIAAALGRSVRTVSTCITTSPGAPRSRPPGRGLR